MKGNVGVRKNYFIKLEKHMKYFVQTRKGIPSSVLPVFDYILKAKQFDLTLWAGLPC